MNLPVLLALAFVASVAGTGLVVHVAPRLLRLDVPNPRSMHTRPTPRGGGIAFVAVILAYTAWATWTGSVDRGTGVALLGSGFVVSALGALDDRRPLPNLWRVLGWAFASTWAIAWLGGIPVVQLGATGVHLGWLGGALGIVGLVWMVNLYNFMDGIDGLAGLQGVLVAGVGGFWLASGGTAQLALVLAASVTGFLVWNWPPARVFMGDAGSGFLGMAFGILAIASERAGTTPMIGWAIVLMVFLVDTLMTLVWRLRRRERFWEPHRAHAYQMEAIRAGSHRRVTLAIGVITGLLGLAAVWASMSPPRLLPTALAAFVATSLAWALVRFRLTGRHRARSY